MDSMFDRYGSDHIPDHSIGHAHRLIAFLKHYGQIYILYVIVQGSPQASITAERVGVVWAEFMTTSIDSLPTSKLN